ncbi:hypothetical protein G6F55_012513 [Rhizopus delemar]|uniref:Integrase zinc-binding domain-containing protein n=1 Tax=Rhizopus delemar TaxID=936053 RepID=A0A9P7CI88_9FUNG|nr:hypothetical protein G6F55_012513 [Rhizopus delemar]KAG1499412.1 hypothetical protein G6F52_012659 [Rhizopus delemar]KAG1556500.1 hypothetical protein G6F50_012728 [Rhizopus delemar]KAG1614550.1 hypothetical protein G6F45_012605 [Rhizopus arrhizus]
MMMPADLMTPAPEDRQKLLMDTHLEGHRGAQAIVTALHSEGIHWTKLKEDTLEIIRSCPDCQKFNIAKHGYNPLTSIYSSYKNYCNDLQFSVGRCVKKFLKSGTACNGVHHVVPPVLTRKYIGLLVLEGDIQTARGMFLRLMELGLSMSYTTAYLGHQWRQILLDKIKQHIATISPRPYSEAWRA